LVPTSCGLLLEPVTMAPPYMYTNTGRPQLLCLDPG
jgi:hypothetical protein